MYKLKASGQQGTCPAAKSGGTYKYKESILYSELGKVSAQVFARIKMKRTVTRETCLRGNPSHVPLYSRREALSPAAILTKVVNAAKPHLT